MDEIIWHLKFVSKWSHWAGGIDVIQMDWHWSPAANYRGWVMGTWRVGGGPCFSLSSFIPVWKLHNKCLEIYFKIESTPEGRSQRGIDYGKARAIPEMKSCPIQKCARHLPEAGSRVRGRTWSATQECYYLSSRSILLFVLDGDWGALQACARCFVCI